MNVLVYLFGAILLYMLAFRYYGRYLGRQVGLQPERPTPAVEFNDGRDFVPTRPSVLFAHHYSAIAGAGPIIGPTLGILYGVGPVWLWVVLGAIFFGAVHDFASLFASIRERGSSMAEIARRALGPTGFLLFILFTVVLIVLVTSAFLSLTAVSLTSLWPLDSLGLDESQTLLRVRHENGVAMGVIGGIASTSVIVITLAAPVLGYLVTRKQIATWLAYLIALAVGALSVWVGFRIPVGFAPTTWMYVIAVYTLFACGLPVWLILQPRDFVNVQILYAGMGAMMLGVLVMGLQGLAVSAPALNLAEGSAKLGPVWPFLFITIACGAISGFHALVCGGTSSKQIAREGQVRTIGYGGMLLEGLLAVLVLITIGSSLSFPEYMRVTWPEVGAGNPILAFSLSMGHLLEGAFGIPLAYGVVFGILTVEGFLITTLDVAVRLNRYLLEEFWRTVIPNPPKLLTEFWFNSAVAVVLMLALAMSNGYKLIWPLFGSTNQLLAALTLIAVTVWLHRAGRSSWYTLIPAAVMICTTIASLSYYLVTTYLPTGNVVLAGTDIVLLLLALGVLGLSLREFARERLAAAGRAAPS
ncbi:MAG TPA: carbon starvation CstA family protein [candidate division Zixibacteria bacterium]|nr:carbon starvation protein A [candidate division Zixibacteria bacterium]MDD4917787.1 carbon starvation CstA family protein [candidate division Zixibacteria bacterium]MDM7971882.1 carbon starvation CstA family protein [candidate division Zixibacteria bacterium]HOZ06937.1 carbon starvation CstA family protein [candidate division Zixibacteria bacterium]HPM36834.1 carbon starvation CstA family protein [candidate division Zixibacteria bacterium]